MKNKELFSTDSFSITLLTNINQPDPHPWEPHLPKGWRIQRGKLETGDIALARLPEGVVIVRKTPSDLIECFFPNRKCFERELRRSRIVERLLIVVEGSLSDVHYAATVVKENLSNQRDKIEFHHNFITDTLASWMVRFCPIIFAGGLAQAADFAFCALAAQGRDSGPCGHGNLGQCLDCDYMEEIRATREEC